MRKEVILAILAGVSIGLITAFGVWKITKSIKKASPNKNILVATPNPKNVDTLTIDGLEDYDVVNKSPLLKGLTSPNLDLVISTLDSDYFTKSNNEGEFEVQIDLPAGLSEVRIKNLGTNNDTKLLLIYSTEVEDGLESYVGTITDISSGTIQVRGNSGGILQISTNEDAKYINTLKKNVEVKQTDLAIGDYIIAIGKANGNGAAMNSKVLNSSRILISSPVEELKLDIKKITIEKLTKTTINDITLPKKWNGPNVSELEVGEEIIVVGTINDKTHTLRSIFKPVQ